MTTRPTLDQATARAVRGALAQLHFSSLYEFLGTSRDASITRLYSAADHRYKELRGRGRSDSDTNTAEKLAGQAMAVFAGIEAKERYDNTLDQEVMGEFDGHLEIIGRDTYLEEVEVWDLVRRAEEKGVSRDVALEYIRNYASRRGWGLESSSSASSGVAPTWRSCAGCGGIIEVQDAFCGFCGARQDGRGGATVQSTSESAAPSRVDRLGWLQGRLHIVRSLKDQLRLMEAAEVLAQIRIEFGASAIRDLVDEVNAGIERAAREVAAGQALRREDRFSEAARTFEHVLRCLCADCRPAQLGLLEIPPTTQMVPSLAWLKVQRVKGGVHLRWVPSWVAEGVTYTVRRAIGAVPASPEDGQAVAESGGLECWDNDVVPWSPCYYAVFAKWGGRVSAPTASGPHYWKR